MPEPTHSHPPDDASLRTAYDRLDQRYRRQAEELRAIKQQLKQSAEALEQAMAEPPARHGPQDAAPRRAVDPAHAPSQPHTSADSPRQTSAALREDEAHFRSIVGLAPDSIATIDLLGRVTSVNAAACGITGYRPEDVVGKPFWKLGVFHVRDLPKYIKLFYSLVRGASPAPFELECYSKDGTRQILESHVGLLRHGDRIVGLQVISRNITDRKRAEEALRREQSFREGIIECAAEGLCVCHATPQFPFVEFTVWNRRMAELTGYTMDQINRLGWYQSMYPDPEVQAKAAARMAAMRVGDNLIGEEWEITRADGQKRTVRISTSLLADDGGAPHVLALMDDVTERKRANDSLLRAKEEWERTFDAVPDLIAVLDDKQRIVRVNRAMTDLLGRSREECLGQACFRVFHGAESAPDCCLFPQVCADDHERSTELRIERFDRDFHVTCSPLFAQDGKRIGTMHVARDITQQKKADSQLRESELRRSLALESVQMGMWDWDLATGKVVWSEASEALWGYAPGEFPGTVEGFASRVHPDDLPEVWRVAEQAQQGRSPFCCEFRVVRPDGTMRWVASHGRCVPDAQGQPARIVGVEFDITQRKQGEELARIQHELALALAACPDLEAGLRLCVDAAIRSTGLDSGGFYLVDEQAGGLDFYVPRGLSAEFVQSVSRYESDSDHTRLVMAGLPAYARFDQMGLDLPDSERREGLRFLAVIPMRHEGRVIGCLNMASHTANDITPAARTALETIAAGAVQAVVRLRAEAARRQSEERLRLVLDASNDGLWDADLRADRAYLSPKYYEMVGYEPGEITPNLDFYKRLIHPDDYARVWQTLLTDLYAPAGESAVEHRIVAKDGAVKWILAKAKVVQRDAVGEPLRVVGTISDITERRQAEEALRRSEEELRLVLEASGTGWWRLDFTTGQVYGDDRCKELLGLPLSIEPKLDAFLALISVEDQARLLNTIAEAGVRPGDHEGEYGVTWTDGSRHWIFLKGRSYHDAQGKPLFFEGIAMDATARKRAEEALRTSEENFRAFFNTVDDCLFVVSLQGAILHVNRSVTERLGYTVDELIGRSVGEVHPEDCREEAARIIGEMVAGRLAYCPLPLLSKAGRRIPAETRVVPGKWDGREVLFGVSKDLSELHALQEQFSKAFHANPTAMAIASVDDGRFLEVNDAFVCLTGYTREEALGASARELGLFVDPSRRDSAMEILREHGGFREIAVALRPKDGQIRHGLFSGELVQLQNRPVALTVMSDVTDRKRAEEMLYESVSRLHATLESTADGILVVDLEGRLVDCNSQFLEMWRFPKDFVLECRKRDLVASPSGYAVMQGALEQLEDREGFVAKVAELYGSPEVSSFDVLRWKDGRIFERFSQPQWIGGQPVGRVWSFRDVTERKRTEDALRESEQRYHSLFEAESDAVFLVDSESGRFLDANSAAARLYGYTREEFLAMGVSDISAQPEQSIASVRDREVQVPVRWHRKKDGATFPVELAGAYFEHHGRTIHVGAIRDITERKRAEDALRESEEHYRLLVETIPQIAWRSNPDASIQDFNRRWFEYTGQTPEDIPNRGWLAAVHAEDQSRVATAVAEAVATGSPFRVEARLRRASDGAYRWHLGRSVPLLGEGGEILSWFGTATDVEDFKQAQLALEKVHDEELKRHRMELAHVGRLSMMGEMAANLAHELNQPLHAVTNYARGSVRRVLKMREKDEELVAVLEQIAVEANRAAEIVRRVRRFVQKDAPEFADVSVNNLIEDVLLLNKADLESAHVAVQRDFAANLPTVSGDPIQIQQVLMNLVRNALESMADGPLEDRVLRITTAYREEGTVQVEVCDGGGGIAPDAMPKIFEPFFTTKPEGMGMGLAISRSIVKAHRGRLWASANHDRGCTFHFTLPTGRRS